MVARTVIHDAAVGQCQRGWFPELPRMIFFWREFYLVHGTFAYLCVGSITAQKPGSSEYVHIITQAQKKGHVSLIYHGIEL